MKLSSSNEMVLGTGEKILITVPWVVFLLFAISNGLILSYSNPVAEVVLLIVLLGHVILFSALNYFVLRNYRVGLDEGALRFHPLESNLPILPMEVHLEAYRPRLHSIQPYFFFQNALLVFYPIVFAIADGILITMSQNYLVAGLMFMYDFFVLGAVILASACVDFNMKCSMAKRGIIQSCVF